MAAELIIPKTGDTALFDDLRYWDGDLLVLDDGSYTGDYTIPTGKNLLGTGICIIDGDITMNSQTSLDHIRVNNIIVVGNECFIKYTTCKSLQMSEVETIDVKSTTITLGDGLILDNCNKCSFENISSNNNSCGINIIDSSSLKFKDATINDNELYGISITGSSKIEFKDSEIFNELSALSCILNNEINIVNTNISNSQVAIFTSQNSKSKISGGSVKFNGVGIKSSLNIKECEISSLEIYSNTLSITSEQDTDIKITNNTITKNNSNGIFINNGDSICLSNNTISNNIGHGISVFDSTKCNIMTNIIHDNLDYGMYLNNCISSSCTKNKIYDSSKYGIFIDNCNLFNIIGDTIERCNQYGIYITNSNECNITSIIDFCDYAIFMYKNTKCKVINSEIRRSKIAIFDSECENDVISNNIIDSINLISLPYTNEGEYAKCMISKELFNEEYSILEKFSSAIIVYNGDSVSINDNSISDCFIGIFIDNNDNCKINSNSLLGNTNGIIINKSKSALIMKNVILQSLNCGIVIHSNLEINSKICMNNIVDSNIISRGRLFYNDINCYIPEYMIPNNSYFIRLKESISENSKSILNTGDIPIVKAYWDVNDYIKSNKYVFIQFLDSSLQENNSKVLRFETIYIDTMLLADLYDKTDGYSEYDVFIFSDSKQNVVMDNYLNRLNIYMNNGLDEIVRQVNSENLKPYLYRKTLETEFKDDAKNLRTLYRKTEDSKEKEKIVMYFEMNGLADKFIMNNMSDVVRIKSSNFNNIKNDMLPNLLSLLPKKE